MADLPAPLRPVMRRLARRVAAGLFVAVWPPWAAGSLLASGLCALACRVAFPGAAPYLPWLWLAPCLATIPAIVFTARRAYPIEQLVALADSLGGGSGLLLSVFETEGGAWSSSAAVESAARVPIPRWRPWRALAPVAVGVAFLAVTLSVPQRHPAGSNRILADEIAAELTGTLSALKQQELVTPEEEKRFEEEIERIRRAARDRMDASTWEAADTLREKAAAQAGEKRDGLKWAEQSLAAYAAAVESGASAAEATAQAAELTTALGKLAKSGLLAGGPADLQQLLNGGKLPSDPKALAKLASSLTTYLQGKRMRLGDLAGLGKEFGRFDPAEFPLESVRPREVDGNPGSGGVDRGRGDAPLTWGKESLPLDRFKAQPLPPGAARSADDWAPLVQLPGAPNETAVTSRPAAARQYGASVGQTAWRRTLAPRHQSAVKKYFAQAR